MAADINAVMARRDDLVAKRYNWEDSWDEIVELVRPQTSYFKRAGMPGDDRKQKKYDSTAEHALEEFASAIQSAVFDFTQRRFSIGVIRNDINTAGIPLDFEARNWLETVSEILFKEFGRIESNFSSALFQGILDIGAFGTMDVFGEWDDRDGIIKYKSAPMSNLWIDEGFDGTVDTAFRKRCLSVRQLAQGFPNLPEQVTKLGPDGKVDLWHAIYPRTDAVKGKTNGKNMAFASVWFLDNERVILEEGGFKRFPRSIARWVKDSGEVYGRSPAMKSLSDVKMVNAMKRTGIMAREKLVSPPLMVQSGLVNGNRIRTGANQINFTKRSFSGQPAIVPMNLGVNPDSILPEIQDLRGQIERAFHIDVIRREKKKERQSAFEIQDDRAEMMGLMAPMLFRIEREFLSPTIVRAFEILDSKGRFPKAPESLGRGKLDIEFDSEATSSQLASKANQMSNFLVALSQMAAIDPSVYDGVDGDEYLRELARLQGTTNKILRAPRQLEEMRAARAQQEQQQQLLESAEPISQATKNFADAQQQL
jgi:hypothetical protein